MKEQNIFYELGCSQNCALPHATRRHGETQVSEYLGQDDWLWEDALGVSGKLEMLEESIRKLREETMQKIYAKKLSYALAYDKADNIENSFKLARDGDWKNLTCSNIFRVQEKLSKGRKIDEKDVKNLNKTILDETEKALELLVKSCLNSSNSNNNNRYDRPAERREDRREYWKEDNYQDRRRQEEEKQPRRVDPPKSQAPNFANNYPFVKVNTVAEIDTHFNIILKVIRVHKQFRINNLRKLQFLGGDETGTAIVVIDYERFIRVGAVVSISNARIYSFHGSKQIQSSNRNSEVKEEKIIMNDVNQEYNLSGRRGNNGERVEWEEKGERRPRRPREDQRQDRPREDRPREDRPQREYPQNSEGRRRPREDRDNRQFRADRNTATYVEERPPRRDREEVRKRYDEDASTRVSRNQAAQKPAEKIERDFGRNKKQSSQPSSDEAEVEEEKNQKENSASSPKRQETAKARKISTIEPGDEELTIFAEVFQLEIAGPAASKGHFLSYIGDETGIVRMQLPKSNPAVKEGAVLRIVNVSVEVDPRDHKITLRLADDGFCDKTNMKVTKVEINNDMSHVEWQSDGEEEEGAIIEDL